MPPKTKITVDLLIGENETMRVEAYESSTPGLSLHRQVAYVPAKEEHKFTSKWQITHSATGTGLLKPSECLSTMRQAERVAAALSDHDWSEPHAKDSAAHKAMLEALATHGSSTDDDDEEGEVEIRRYIVRRNPEGAGYVIVDTSDDSVVDEVLHRGLASEQAKEMNGKVSI